MFPVRLCIIFICLPVISVFSFPDQGQWSKHYESVNTAYFGVHKSLSAGSTVSFSVNCEPSNAANAVKIRLGWVLRQTSCFEEYYLESDTFSEQVLRMYYNCPMNTNGFSQVRYLPSPVYRLECTSRIHLEFVNSSFFPNSENIEVNVPSECNNFPTELVIDKTENGNLDSSHAVNVSNNNDHPTGKLLVPKDEKQNLRTIRSTVVGDKLMSKNMAEEHEKDPNNKHSIWSAAMNASFDRVLPIRKGAKDGSKVASVDMDGIYLFVVKITSLYGDNLNLTVSATMKDEYGYLSAVDYPLLWFYGVMCGVYVLYASSWLIVSALQWRDLLRIQFWIGGVILLGLIEKAVFYEEYHSINSTGQSVQGAVLFAEILSCMKRTLARMLVIIVSLGFGIVKPRLGPVLHRVVGVGALYFVLGTLEGCLRVLKPKNDLSKQALIAGIPLAVTDSAICWWIFSSLVQTIRTLRLRRNLVKLSLYHHFTNTLIFAVLASVAFMVWSIHSHKLVTCITDWKELWVDEAYWHLLFSLVLLVIMILWRPTKNNQRYAFTPLLDAADDENDDDFDSSLSNDAFIGMKMRTSKNQSSLSPMQNDSKNKQDEDLKWVEENIPSSLTEAVVPSLLDSDEEIMTAKFERNKME